MAPWGAVEAAGAATPQLRHNQWMVPWEAVEAAAAAAPPQLRQNPWMAPLVFSFGFLL
jgi:hypothetical protein